MGNPRQKAGKHFEPLEREFPEHQAQYVNTHCMRICLEPELFQASGWRPCPSGTLSAWGRVQGQSQAWALTPQESRLSDLRGPAEERRSSWPIPDPESDCKEEPNSKMLKLPKHSKTDHQWTWWEATLLVQLLPKDWVPDQFLYLCLYAPNDGELTTHEAVPSRDCEKQLPHGPRSAILTSHPSAALQEALLHPLPPASCLFGILAPSRVAVHCLPAVPSEQGGIPGLLLQLLPLPTDFPVLPSCSLRSRVNTPPPLQVRCLGPFDSSDEG